MKRLFGGSGRFNPSPAAKRIPAVVVREITADDHDVCIGIYRENEANHLPSGYFQQFNQDLSSDADLWLAVEEAGVPIGMGGVHIDTTDGAVAVLVFGMVRPDRHRMGYGSALLLARIAALPPPDPMVRVFMTSVGGSVDFYKRFGFVFVDRKPMEDGKEVDFYYTRITRPAWEASRAILASRQVAFDPDTVSVPYRTHRD